MASVKAEAGLALKNALAGDDGEAIAEAFEALKGACSYSEEEGEGEEMGGGEKKPALVLALGKGKA